MYTDAFLEDLRAARRSPLAPPDGGPLAVFVFFMNHGGGWRTLLPEETPAQVSITLVSSHLSARVE